MLDPRRQALVVEDVERLGFGAGARLLAGLRDGVETRGIAACHEQPNFRCGIAARQGLADSAGGAGDQNGVGWAKTGRQIGAITLPVAKSAV